MRRRGSTGGPSSDLVHARGQLAQGPHLERVSQAGEGTRVTNSVELELHGPGRLLGRVAVPRVREAVAANLGNSRSCWRDRLSDLEGAPRPTALRCGTVPSLDDASIQADRARTRVHTCSPVLLLIVARVLWTARPPARPALGAEATIAEPAGPMTFRCPLAVRSTCPPARCTAATISLASLERQRFGVACFFSAIPDDLSIPRTRP